LYSNKGLRVIEIRIHAFIEEVLVDSRLCIHLRDVFVIHLNNICL